MTTVLKKTSIFPGTARSVFRRDPTIVAHFPGLAGATGGLVDISGNAYNATARGTPNANYFGRHKKQAYRYVNTKTGGAKYIDFPGSATITWAAGTKLSIAFWFYAYQTVTESGEANWRFMEKSAQSNGGASGNWNLAYSGNGLSLGYSNSANSASYSISQADVYIHKEVWYHVIWTYSFPTGSDATKPSLFVNGRKQLLGAWNSTPNGSVITATGETCKIGADSYGATYGGSDNRGMNGMLDEVVFWKGREITPAEAWKFYRMSSRSRAAYVHAEPAAAGGSAVAAMMNSYRRMRAA